MSNNELQLMLASWSRRLGTHDTNTCAVCKSRKLRRIARERAQAIRNARLGGGK